MPQTVDEATGRQDFDARLSQKVGTPFWFLDTSMTLTRLRMMLATALIASVAGAASTPEAATTERLTWISCVEQTQRENPELKAAANTLLAAEYSARGAASGFFPQVTGSLGYQHGDRGADPLAAAGTTTNDVNLSLAASQNIFNGLQDRARVAQSQANARSALADLETTRARVSFALKSAYAGLLYAQGSETLQLEIVRRRQENLRMVELRFDGGRENKGSLLLSRAYLNQARFDALQAKNQAFVAQAQLARVMGRDEDSELEISNDLPLTEPPSVSDFRPLMLDTPTHRQSLAKEDAAAAGVTIARSGFFPSLGVSGNWSRQGESWFPESAHWSVGTTLTLPIFSGGRDYYSTRSSGALYRAAAQSRADSDRNLVSQLKQAQRGFIEAVEKLKVDESFVQAASTRAEIARAKYNNGLLSFEDWDLIENDLIQRQRAALQSLRDRIVAEAAWEQALGRGVIR